MGGLPTGRKGMGAELGTIRAAAERDARCIKR